VRRMQPSLSVALDADERACAGHPRTVVSLLLCAAYNAAMQPTGSTVENKLLELPRLETPRLVLRALSLDDADDIFAYASDSEVTRYTIFERHLSSKTTTEWLRSVIDTYRDGHPGPWGMELRSSRRLIGACGFRNWETQHGCAEMGYTVTRAYWNQGYASEAVRALIAFGFEHMNLNRIEARAVPANLGSTRVMEKAGMKFEGVLRQSEFFKGAYQDLAIYSILRHDPWR
jgi:[ribosomal protein S5]-alanine N-acetyltransferase